MERFTRENWKKTSPNKLSVEKVIKRKSDKLYFKWKGYNNSFNSWIDKKDIVQMSEYFPKQKCLGATVKVFPELELVCLIVEQKQT